MIFDILRFLIAVLLLNAPIALARDPEIIVSTHTYKKVGNLKINLDTHRLISVEGGEHGLGGGNLENIRASHAAILPFIEKFMK